MGIVSVQYKDLTVASHIVESSFGWIYVRRLASDRKHYSVRGQ